MKIWLYYIEEIARTLNNYFKSNFNPTGIDLGKGFPSSWSGYGHDLFYFWNVY